MFDCQNLLHPFQNDPGTSQRQRVIESLLSDTVKIDGRSLTDLIDYFARLSAGINYFDKNLNTSDWQPFFSRSTPFLLASISKYDFQSLAGKYDTYKFLFDKSPSVRGLQLMIHFIYYNTIDKIYQWNENISDSGLPVALRTNELIRNNLAQKLRGFIGLANAAAKTFGIRRIDFSKFINTKSQDAWNIEFPLLYAVNNEINPKELGKCEVLRKFHTAISAYMDPFLEAMKSLADPAGESIGQSLVPLANELKQDHPPHLALIFAFIRLFQKMQDELNKKTKEHLKFFYTEVLRIKPAAAQPDKANIVLELQKILQNQYKTYRLEKGTRLNGGRDDRNADILFDTDEEIIINETQVAELRTLYLNNEQIYDNRFLEGVYMAPKANMANGVDKEFKEDDPKNWYTVGNKTGKYKMPGKSTPLPYPAARLGFVLASPVLYLAEGDREVTVTLDCFLNDTGYPDFYSAKSFYTTRVRNFLFDTVTGLPRAYFIVSDQLLDDAREGGISATSTDAIRDFFLLINNKFNLCTQGTNYRESVQVEYTEWEAFLNDPARAELKSEVEKLPDLFKKQYPLKILFSGEKEWLEPSAILRFSMTPLNLFDGFTFQLVLKLHADKPAVTFYNKENLKEDIGTELPALKIQINDALKIEYLLDPAVRPDCCLQKSISAESHRVSLYHFFRNIIVKPATKIDVKVCGLRNFVVQNDENVMDVNSPVYPFGTRPDVASFDLVNPVPVANPDAAGPSFFIGSKEIFNKKWTRVDVNLNWKNKPENFNDYYKGYIRRVVGGVNVFGLDENAFEYRLGFLSNGQWKAEPVNRKLFRTRILPPPAPQWPLLCNHNFTFDYSIMIDFPALLITNPSFTLSKEEMKVLDVNSRNGFIRLNLRNQDFGHKNYSFILARQMMAYSKLPKETIGSAVYYDKNGDPIVIDFDTIYNDIKGATNKSVFADNDTTILDGIIQPDAPAWNWDPTPAQGRSIRDIVRGTAPLFPTPFAGIKNLIRDIKDALAAVKAKIDTDEVKKYAAVIPNEPWTPVISNMVLDYTASATSADIDLVHLYPYANTYKKEEIELSPALFPSFADEGTLFIGLKDFRPGVSLNMLFQMAEATADSETGKEDIKWQYLGNNAWNDLRDGFEVVQDGTQDLTSSGILKFALPENMTNANTVMPGGIFWIKASVEENSRSVSETISIQTQAISATFVIIPGNDLTRLDHPLEAGAIAKLLVADPVIKKLDQPFGSFNGKLSELEGSYYQRVSELLRHKGRAIQKWDYERLVMENFPEIYKAKCINHTFKTNAHQYSNDVPYAPGYVLLALIPDLRRMDAGNSFEPSVPVSLLEKIETYFKKVTSPFVRISASNPRYERVDFCITVRIRQGRDPNYYKERLKSELREFLAPWAVGKFDKLSFGQCIYRSDILRFLERTGYVDFVNELRMTHENEPLLLIDQPKVCPVSPRSILLAGNVDVRVDDPACDEWCIRGERIKNCEGPVLFQNYCKE